MIFLFILSQVFPKPYGFVNDYAKILNVNQLNDLEEYLRDIEKRTSVEIAIAIFDSIGYPIEEYANLLFEKWGIGKKGKDNGILILVSIKERLIRIEVGYGLEAVITDGIAGEIIRKNIAPYFREGNYYLGLKSAILEIEKRISNEEQSKEGDINKNKDGLGFLFFIGLIVGVLLSYIAIFLGSILLIIAIVYDVNFIFLLSIGLILGGIIYLFLFRRGGGYYYHLEDGGFGGFPSSGGFGGFGGGLSGGGGATGRW